MRVHDVMIRDVARCQSSSTLEDAVALMAQRGCGFLPVVGSDGVVVGVVTDRDIALCAWRRRLTLAALQVNDAMNRAPVVVGDEETVERAEQVMAEARVHRLPVVNGSGVAVGVISLGDIAQAPRRGGSGSHRDDVVATLQALAGPREVEPR